MVEIGAGDDGSAGERGGRGDEGSNGKRSAHDDVEGLRMSCGFRGR